MGVEPRIRPFEAADAEVLKAFGSAHGEPVDGARWRRTLVAEVSDTIVGAGSLRRSPMHRDVCTLEIDTADAVSGLRQLGRPLYEGLLRLRPEPWAVLWRAMASRPERLEFAQAARFDVVVRCPSPRVDPTSVEMRRWIAEHENAPDAVVRTADSCSTEELLDAWTGSYEWAHASWIPVTSVEAVRQTLATSQLPGVDRSLSAVAVRADRIVALALVSPDVWDGRTFVIAETVHRDQPDGRALVGAVMAASLRRLGESGRTSVEFEGHTIDPHYAPLAATLPTIGGDPLTILMAG
jgi:hypothetical protein